MSNIESEVAKLKKENAELIFLLKVAYADLMYAAPYFNNYQGIRGTAESIMKKLTELKETGQCRIHCSKFYHQC